MLQGIDTLVVDLQDVGARFYTYISTVGYLLEESARRNIRVVVLDRPNPVNGFSIEGPVADEDARGFTAYLPDADASWHDDGGAGEAFQRREQDWRRPGRRTHGALVT